MKHTEVCTHRLVSLPQKRSLKYISYSSEIHFFRIEFFCFYYHNFILFFTSSKGVGWFFSFLIYIYFVANICSLYNLQGGNQTKERGQRKRCVAGCSINRWFSGRSLLSSRGRIWSTEESPPQLHRRGVDSLDTSDSNNDNYDPPPQKKGIKSISCTCKVIQQWHWILRCLVFAGVSVRVPFLLELIPNWGLKLSHSVICHSSTQWSTVFIRQQACKSLIQIN